MHWLKSIGREVLGLFVENGSFAIAILVWLVLSVILLSRIDLPVHWTGPILFGGLAMILIESVVRFSAASRK